MERIAETIREYMPSLAVFNGFRETVLEYLPLKWLNKVPEFSGESLITITQLAVALLAKGTAWTGHGMAKTLDLLDFGKMGLGKALGMESGSTGIIDYDYFLKSAENFLKFPWSKKK